ncbi:hypothetical protein RRF57_005725 [Xylaria bambusicola]|uniref:Uncharacterized protein n=1 Tax=Xylaria bambusicola TaxID=326684 RepID=A0AAN7UD40_9PEZI
MVKVNSNLEEIHSLDKRLSEEYMYSNSGVILVSPQITRLVAANTGGVGGAICRGIINHRLQSRRGIEQPRRHATARRLERRQTRR